MIGHRFFFRARFTSSILTPLLLPSSSVSRARVFGKTPVHELPISYNCTESYLLFSRNVMIEMVEESPVLKRTADVMQFWQRFQQCFGSIIVPSVHLGAFFHSGE